MCIPSLARITRTSKPTWFGANLALHSTAPAYSAEPPLQVYTDKESPTLGLKGQVASLENGAWKIERGFDAKSNGCDAKSCVLDDG